MSEKTTYLITGANRGIGLGLLEAYLLRPNHTIIATVRDPTTSSAALTSLPTAAGTTLIILKIDSQSPTDPLNAISTLQTTHNITTIDVVIANAGLGATWVPVLQTTPELIRELHEVNTIGPLLLFQATWPLLQKSKNPKFIFMSTGLASFVLAEHLKAPSAAYGASKAAGAYLARKIHFEHENLTTVILYPGWVKTDLGYSLAKAIGVPEPTTTLEVSYILSYVLREAILRCLR